MTELTGIVLLIAGDCDEAAKTRTALSQAGLAIEQVDDIQAAIRTIADRRFDAVLIGLDKNASDAVAFLKGSDARVPVVVMSNPGGDGMPVEAIKYVLSGVLLPVKDVGEPVQGAIDVVKELIFQSRSNRLGAMLQEEVRKLTYLVENLPECILMIDRTGTIAYANRAFYYKYEYTRGELAGTDFTRLLAGPVDRERLKNLIRTSSLEGSNAEIATVTRRGNTILSVAVLTPRYDAAAAVFAHVLLLQDITDSRYAETTLQRRISALTSPEVDLSSLDFKDLIRDLAIQELQDTMSAAFGVASVIVAPDGTPLNTRSNFTQLCLRIAGADGLAAGCCLRCIDDIVRRAVLNSGARYSCPCTGMVEAAIPMSVNGHTIAFWIIGQVAITQLDPQKLTCILADAGIPSGEARGIIAALPRMTEYQFKQVVATFSVVSEKVTRMAIQNLQQGKYINERNLALEGLQRSELLLKDLSYHDGLTGLYNRSFFELELERLGSDATKLPVSFVAVDVDGLKLINDTLGHTAGDQHIRSTGQLLSSVFSDMGTICRIGGDEFCVILPCCDEIVAGKLLDRLHSDIGNHNDGQSRSPVSMSVGLATTGADELLPDAYKRADRMMYENKVRNDYSRSKSIDMILLALSERDYMDHGHTRMLTSIVDAMAQALGLGEDAQASLKLLARLHDLGKIGVPDEIVMKPGSLDDGEWVLMRSHVEIGANIASRSFHLGSVARLIRHHHERYDGSGYPSGFAGDQIPLECRILAIADAYDAMIADRPYRKGLGREHALCEIRKNAGTQFDPLLVAIFDRLVESGSI